MTRIARPPLELEEEAFRLADEWVEVDTPFSLMEYIYNHASPALKGYMDEASLITAKNRAEHVV